MDWGCNDTDTARITSCHSEDRAERNTEFCFFSSVYHLVTTEILVGDLAFEQGTQGGTKGRSIRRVWGERLHPQEALLCFTGTPD